jgi:hypothetical protein
VEFVKFLQKVLKKSPKLTKWPFLGPQLDPVFDPFWDCSKTNLIVDVDQIL